MKKNPIFMFTMFSLLFFACVTNAHGKNVVLKVNQESFTYEIFDVKIIETENYCTAPVWAPDGNKFAFTTLNFKGIYIRNLKDGLKKQITSEDGAGFRFCWSPDSKEIVYLERRFADNELNNIAKIVNVETGKIIALTNGLKHVSMPSFLKTNSVIYSSQGNLILRKVSFDNITLRKAFNLEEVITKDTPANIIIETPAEDKFIIEDDNGIKIMDSNGKNKKVIIANGPNDFAVDAKVSPDGNKVLFYNNVKSVGHLYVYDIRNENLIDLGEGYFGQWLPDGKVIYCITTDDGYVITSSELYLINSDGTSKKMLTNTKDKIELQPAVSPDGANILFRDDISGKIFSGELRRQ